MTTDWVIKAESELLSIFREVMKRPDLTRNSDFFSFGGTSSQAVEIAARAEAALGVSVPVTLILIHANAHQIASRLSESAVS